MSKILMVSLPQFINGLKEIVSTTPNHSFDFISSKEDSFQNKTRVEKAKIFKKYDIVHFFWANTNVFDLLYYKIFSKSKIINHFIGTDLYNILNRNSTRKTLELRICSYLSKFIVTGSNMEKELDDLHIKYSRIDFINSNIKKREYTYPSDKVSIVYLPSFRKSFYRYSYFCKLALDFPESKFIWFPYKRENNENLPKNVETIEYIEHDKIFTFLNDARVFIRLPEHDGLPNTLIESLSIGRWAIWSFYYYAVETVVNYDELHKAFDKLINKNEANYEGASYVIENYNIGEIKKNFINLYN